MTPNPKLIEFLNLTPPALVRAMALVCGKGRKPKLMSLVKISSQSGLSLRMITRLQFRSDWSGVKIDVASLFIEGCNVEILRSQRKSGSPEKKMTRYDFYRKYVAKGLPHMNENQRARLCKILNWEL